MKRFLLVAGTGVLVSVVLLAGVPANAATPAPGGYVTIVVNSRSATFPTPISCAQTAHTYRVTAASQTVHGATATISLAVAGYHGPATYPATVVVTERQTDAAIRTLTVREALPATITDWGGFVTLKRTSVDGVQVSGSARWACA